MTADEFKQTVCVYLDDMYRVALFICGNSADAADALQDASMKLWEIRDHLAGVTNMRAYCITAARNASLSLVASRRHSEPIDNAYPLADDLSDESKVENADAIRRIETIMAGMTDNQRIVLRMRDFEQREVAEIVQATGLTPENIRVLLCRARSSIRKFFEK